MKRVRLPVNIKRASSARRRPFVVTRRGCLFFNFPMGSKRRFVRSFFSPRMVGLVFSKRSSTVVRKAVHLLYVTLRDYNSFNSQLCKFVMFIVRTIERIARLSQRRRGNSASTLRHKLCLLVKTVKSSCTSKSARSGWLKKHPPNIATSSMGGPSFDEKKRSFRQTGESDVK